MDVRRAQMNSGACVSAACCSRRSEFSALAPLAVTASAATTMTNMPDHHGRSWLRSAALEERFSGSRKWRYLVI